MSVNTKDQVRTSFLEAVKKGHLDVVRAILNDHPETVNAKDENGMTAIVIASYCGQYSVAEMLALKGARLNFFEAAMLGRTEQLQKALVENSDQLNSYSSDGFTALHFAAFFGRSEAVQVLISEGADVNAVAQNPTRVTPLHSAVAHSHNEIIKLLLENGANPNSRQQGGFTPLQGAAQSGDLEAVELLVAHGANINDANDKGKTALATAKEGGPESGSADARERVAEYLLGRGASR